MTVRGLYEWAEEHQALDYEIGIKRNGNATWEIFPIIAEYTKMTLTIDPSESVLKSEKFVQII
jgi:hypothetical protein